MECFRRRRRKNEFISATEIACWAYCPEQWRLQYGLELLPANQAALEAGTRHHARKAVAERIAGGLMMLGRAMMAAAILVLLAWVLLR
jgi:hypothetical protein